MAKIIGKDILESYSQNLVLTTPIRARDLPELLKIPENIAEVMIIVCDHQTLDDDDCIGNDDEIYLFLAVMGG